MQLEVGGAVLEDQLQRRRAGELPAPEPDREWTIEVDGTEGSIAFTTKRPKTLPRTVSVDEAFALCDAPKHDGAVGLRDRAIIELLYGAGLRVSELCGLDLADIDLKRLSVRVLGKGRKERVVPFHEAAREAIVRYVHDRIQGSDFVQLAATGHCPNLSAPEETVAAIKNWL